MSRHGPDFFPKGRFLIIQNPRIIAVCSSSTSRLDRLLPDRPWSWTMAWVPLLPGSAYGYARWKPINVNVIVICSLWRVAGSR